LGQSLVYGEGGPEQTSFFSLAQAKRQAPGFPPVSSWTGKKFWGGESKV
jgi:hypothetical protein